MNFLHASHILAAHDTATSDNKQAVVKYLSNGQITRGGKDAQEGAQAAANGLLELLDYRITAEEFDMMVQQLVENKSKEFALSLTGTLALAAIHLDPPVYQ